MERDDVFERVRAIIANTLELDKEEINLDSSLIDDLGMESVDLVDISAKFEEEFNIEIGEGELWNFGEIFADETMMKEGKLTVQGIKYLRERFPADDFREIKPGASIVAILSSINVEFIVHYLLNK